jgi:putative ABC transport system substrate-binding protein
MFFTERRRIVNFVVKHQLPTMFGAREYAELAGLMAYGANIADLFRRSATYVDISKYVGRVKSFELAA